MINDRKIEIQKHKIDYLEKYIEEFDIRPSYSSYHLTEPGVARSGEYMCLQSSLNEAQ